MHAAGVEHTWNGACIDGFEITVSGPDLPRVRQVYDYLYCVLRLSDDTLPLLFWSFFFLFHFHSHSV